MDRKDPELHNRPLGKRAEKLKTDTNKTTQFQPNKLNSKSPVSYQRNSKQRRGDRLISMLRQSFWVSL